MTRPERAVDRSAADVVVAGYRRDLESVELAARCEDPALRRAAIGALHRIGALDADRLRTFAADTDPAVRRRAAEMAPRVDDAGTTEALLVLMLDDEPEIVEMACFALGEIGSADHTILASTTVATIETVARSHPDALCREAAVAALGALHTGLPTILAACNDKATVRRRAVIALAPFDGPDVEHALHAAMEDRDWQVRQAAEDLLSATSTAGHEHRPDVVEGLDTGSSAEHH